jgi:transposase
MITPPSGARIYLARGVTDMRKGFDGLVAQVERMLQLDPHAGSLFIFGGRRGDLIKGIFFDGQGLVLFANRLEKGRFAWPQAKDGTDRCADVDARRGHRSYSWLQPDDLAVLLGPSSEQVEHDLGRPTELHALRCDHDRPVHENWMRNHRPAGDGGYSTDRDGASQALDQCARFNRWRAAEWNSRPSSWPPPTSPE